MRKRILQGFTLIELMIAVAIIGILAAFAFPIYKDFVIRTKVAELVAAMGPLKSAIAEKAHQDSSLDAAGVGVTVAIAGKVTGGSVTDAGVITISGNAAALGTDVTLVLTPTLAPRGQVIWACSTATTTFKYVPSECRH